MGVHALFFSLYLRFQLYLVASLCGATLTSAAFGTLIDGGGGLPRCTPTWNSARFCQCRRRSSRAFFICSFSCKASFFLWRCCSRSAILWSFFCSFFSSRRFLFQQRCFCRCLSDFLGGHLLRCRFFFRVSCERDLFAMMPEFEQLMPMHGLLVSMLCGLLGWGSWFWVWAPWFWVLCFWCWDWSGILLTRGLGFPWSGAGNRTQDLELSKPTP